MGNYLVTGGAGFVGSKLSKALLRLGHEVLIIDNLNTGYIDNIPENATFIEGDCSKQETIDKLNNVNFDAIFHIAGQSSGEISFENPLYDINCNTISTLLLLQYAVKTKCNHIIYASTMSVYGDHEKQIVSELDETNPKSFYAIGKLASEKYLKVYKETYGINYSILRYFNIYGPGQNMENMKQGMVSIFLKQILSDDFSEITVKGSLNRFRDFIYIDDLIEVTLNALNNPRMENQIINVGTGIKTSIKDVLSILMEKTKIIKPVIELEGTLGDQFGIYSNTDKLFSVQKCSFTNFEDGIELFVKSLKS
jgi:UDP-glucose 4-epimerase